MKGRIVYIAGPITDRLKTYRADFAAAANHLEELGAVVLNPSMLPAGLPSHAAYMRICRPMLAEADAIALLPGWEESKGAKMEEGWAAQMALDQYLIHLGEAGGQPFVRAIEPRQA